MTPIVAIALAYGVVGAGILVYLQRVRRRLREAETALRAQMQAPGPVEGLTVR